MVGNPLRGELVKLVELFLGVVLWSVIHVDPVDQIFLDPVTAEVGILRLDARDGLIEVEPFTIGPDELAFPGVELHVLHDIAEGVRELAKLLALRRMPPCQEVVKEGIADKDVVLQLVRMVVVPLPMRVFHCVVTRQRRSSTEDAVKARQPPRRWPSAGSIARRAT